MEDRAALEEKLGRSLSKQERSRIGVSSLKLFLEELLQKRYPGCVLKYCFLKYDLLIDTIMDNFVMYLSTKVYGQCTTYHSASWEGVSEHNKEAKWNKSGTQVEGYLFFLCYSYTFRAAQRRMYHFSLDFSSFLLMCIEMCMEFCRADLFKLPLSTFSISSTMHWASALIA